MPLVYGSAVGGVDNEYITISMHVCKKCDYILARIAAATATYFIAGAIVGLVFFLASPNYDYFMGIKT